MRFSLLTAALALALLPLAPAAGQDPVDFEKKGINTIAQWGRHLERKPAEASRVASNYTSFLLSVPKEPVWHHILARVHTRRAEAYLASFEFDSAVQDFREANRLWPGLARETLLSPLPDPVRETPSGGSDDDDDDGGTVYVSYSDYYDLGDMALVAHLKGGGTFWTNFTLYKQSHSDGGEQKIKPVSDLGLDSLTPFPGATVLFSLGDNVDLNLDLHFLFLSGETETDENLRFDGVELNPLGGTRSLRTMIRLFHGWFWLAAPIDDDEEGYSDVCVGLRWTYMDTRIKSSGNDEAAEDIFRNLVPFFGLRFGTSLNEDDTVFFSFHVRAMYLWWPINNNTLSATLLWAKFEFDWRLFSWITLNLAVSGEHYSWDVERNKTSPNRNELETFQGLTGELALEVRF